MRLFDESAPARSSAARAATRLSLGASPAVLAAMLALQPQVAQAQAFQGTETVILGSVTRGTSGNNDFFTVDALQNTINWTPTDTAISAAPIDFLPAGAFASFSGGSGTNGANYTVLNRIIAADPTRAIAFSGTVSSDAAGRIWFYAPGGLLLNAGSQFNVGGLLLTANDPVGAAAGLPYLNAANQFQLQAASGSTAGVTINAGATINSNSYMIAVAPRFAMNGTVSVGTSAALVAAEDASFTLNGGLFDITANIGTTAGGTSQVGGTITGPGGLSGQGVFSRIYLMAVPRNNAMTLLISGGGQLGFNVATAADVDGNAVVLSGGYDIVGTPAGQGVQQFGLTPSAGSNAAALVIVNGKNITSSLTMRSKDEVRVETNNPTAISFASDLQAFSDTSVVLFRNAAAITVAGNVLLDASTQFTGLNQGANRTAGTVTFLSSGAGQMQVDGNFVALANGFGDDASSPGVAGGTGRGGIVSIDPNDGGLQAANIILRADGIGGVALDGNGGSGIGGNASVVSDALAPVSTLGDLIVSANAIGIVGSAGRLSGNAQGGSATANILGGTFTTSGVVSISANAGYAEVGDDAHTGGGTATAGTAGLFVNNGASFTASSVAINAIADGGLTVGNNSFVGGTARLHAQNGGGPVSITVNGNVLIDASAFASSGIAGGNVNGGAATGGFAQLLGLGNPLLNFGGDGTRVVAEARAGNGDGGVGGNANGGRAHVDMQNGGSLLIGANLDVIADATGGSGTVGGNAVGWDQGDANAPAVFVRLGPNVGVNDQGMQVAGSLFASAAAVGGDGSTGVGGNATGGFVVLRGQSGTIAAPSVSLLADATGGFGVGGGAARSGRLFGGFDNANLTTGALTLGVDATGGDASNGGRGGNATVGQAFFVLSSLEAGPGTTVNAGSVTLLAAAQGGAGGGANVGTGGAGGDAFGVDPNAAEPQLVIASRPARSSFIATQVAVDNSVIGGEGGGGLGTANGGRGGNAVGGQINIGTTSGPVTPVSNRSTFDFGTIYFVDGRVTGGNGGGIDGDGLGGRGGDATGGGASLLARGAVVTAGAVSILSSAFGGNGGGGGNGDFGGGNAIGGEASILATPHFTAGLPVDVTITGPATLIASALGGSSSAAAGEGQGGAAFARLQRHEAAGAAAVTAVGSMSIASLSADAGGVGGAAVGSGAAGGAGIGGNVDIVAEGGSFDLIGGAQLTAIGRGRNGATGNTGQAGGAGGAGSGGSASITVRPGGILAVPFVTVDVAGRAGLGGDGGSGANGLAAAIPLPPQRDGNAGGNGQAGGIGGAGGQALGGSITIGTPAANSGGSITISSWTLLGEAEAGRGGNGGAGGAGANGGNGLDGDAIFINGGNGGAGGNGGTGGNAGAGGNATGGSLLIGAASNDQGSAWSLNVPLSSPSLTTSAGSSGIGGQGGTPGLGGAGGAAGTPPGVAGTPGANGFFGAFGLESFAGFATGANLRVLLFNANFTAPGIDLSADATGAFSSNAQAGDADAGAAELVISGGTTSLGYIRLSAAGLGGDSISGTGGIGRGGSVAFRLLDGADVTLGGRIAPLQLVADGYGGDGLDGGLGSSGFAGSILTQVSNANLQVNGDLVMVAEGFTGFDGLFASGTGGTLTLSFEDGSTVGVTGQLVMSARAVGPVANGGFVDIVGTGTGSLQVDGDIAMDANAQLQFGQPGAPSAAGQLVVSLDVDSSLVVGGQLGANASATSFSQVPNASMAGGGITFGNRGTASVGGALSFDASAIFGDGAGGEAIGGFVLIESLAGTLESNGLSLSASAEGGFIAGGAVPTAFGGSIVLRNEAGAAHFSRSGNIAMTVNATGISNSNGPGGDGAAGTISVAAGGTLELDMVGTGTFVAEVIGTGGNSFNGDPGGNGTGGGIDFDVGVGGTLNIINSATPVIELKANGIGGNSLTQGGTGGGGAIFVVSEGSLTLPALTVNVRGEGGLGLPSGNAIGGRTDVVVRGGLISIGGDLVLDGNAVVAGGSVEGDGTGGLLSVDVSAGTLDVAGDLQMLAIGDGRQSRGGTVSIDVGGTLAVLGGTLIDARGLGTVSDSLATMDGGSVSVDVAGTGLFDAGSSFLADVSALPLLAMPGAPARAGAFTLTSAGAITTTGIFTVNAFANFTLGGEGGLAQGGPASLLLTGGSFDSAGLSLQVGATGGNAVNGTGGDAAGGNAILVVSGGAVATINGNFDAISPGIGGNGDAGGIGTAGSSILRVDGAGSRIDVANITLGTQGTGGNGNSLNGGAGQGGTALLELLNGASVASTGTLALRVGGFGGAGLAGGAATGGSAGIVARFGAQLLGAALLDQLTAGALGGVGSSADGGAALGGAALIRSESGGSLALGGVRIASAGSTGGNGAGAGNGGAAISGTVEISADGGAVDITNLQDVFTSANGGNALGSGNGGEGRGGTVSILASNAGQISILATGGTTGIGLGTSGVGGNAVSGLGGDGTGGFVQVNADTGSQITLDGRGSTTPRINMRARGIGGQGGTGGRGFGGTVAINGDNDSVLNIFGPTELFAEASGGAANNGFGGDALGGAIRVVMTGNAIANLGGPFIFNANGTAGAGLLGGVGNGGILQLEARNSAIISGGATIDQFYAEGFGGAGSAGTGGRGQGGDANIIARSGGSVTLGTIDQARVRGVGGSGDGIGDGGEGLGGRTSIDARAGSITVGTVSNLSATGEGGAALGSGVGGNGTGGRAEVEATTAGTLTIIATAGSANGFGMTSAGVGGNSAAGTGGAGLGGEATIRVEDAGVLTIDGRAASGQPISVRARGVGGNGASGGAATGGQVLVFTERAATLILQGTAELMAEAAGGQASQGSGGDAFAGRVDLLMAGAVATTSITTDNLTILAGATAGNGAGILGRGGTADRANFNGVFIGSNNNRGTLTTGNITATMTATGGRGGDGLTNDGGDGGGASAADFAMGFRANVAGGPDAGTISTGIVNVNLNAVGGAGGAGSSVDGAGGNGGFGTAGSAFLTAVGGTLRIAPASTIQSGLVLNATGRGGAGGAALIGGNGGTGRGGSTNMGSFANPQAGGQSGRFETGRQQLTMDGFGGAGVVGGDAFANFLELNAPAGSTQINGRVIWSAQTFGGASTGGIGGLAAGGGFNLLGTIAITGSVTVEGEARGGNGSTGGGEARGGLIGLRGNLNLQGGFEGFIEADGGNATVSGTGGLARGGLAQIEAANGQSLGIAGFAEIFADTQGGSGASGGDATGAIVRFTTQLGSAIDLGGVDIRGNANGGAGGVLAPQGPARAGSASGGDIVFSSSGTMRVRSNLSIQQARTAGAWLNGIGDGGSATGGTMSIRAIADPNLGGGQITVDGVLSVEANAVGGDVNFVQPGAGGVATGTNLTLSATTGAAVDLVGGAAVIMNTRGGSSGGGAGGASTGARFVTTVNASTVDIGGTGLDVIIDSRGGTGVGGGASQGAAFDLFVDSGVLSVAGDTAIRAESAGGIGALGGSGGSAGGADIRLLLTGPDNNSRLQLSTAGTVEINTITRGGLGGDGSAGGAGAAATGGSIELGAIGSTGTVGLGDVQASVFAEGGAGGNGVTVGGSGGSSQGGFVSVGMAGNTQGPAGSFTIASANLDASARSGNGGAGQTVGASGDATAGSVGLAVRGATGSVAGNIDLFANAVSLGAARGGVVELSSEGGSNGVAGDFVIAGNVVAETRTTGTTTQAGAVRVFALDGSRLAMATLGTSANGALPSALPERDGLVADTGSTISIAGSGTVVSQQSLGLNNGGTINVGGTLFVSSGGQVRSAFDVPTAGATGTIAAQVLQVAGTAGINLVTGTTGSGDVFMSSAAGQVRVTDIDANRDVTLNGVAGTSFTSVRGDRNVGVFSDVAIIGGSASAGGRLTVSSDGGITVGALDAGVVDPAAGVTPDIYVRALGPITTGAVTSGGDVGLLAQGALTSGAITSGRDLVLLSGGTITTAALTTPTTGRIRIDDFAQRSLISFPGGVPDYTALFAATPTARAGDTIINGNLTTGLFEARSTGLLRVTGTINASIGARLGVGSLQIGSTASQGFLDLSAVDSLVLADLNAQGQISLASDGSITAGTINTGQSLVLAANRPGATLTTGNVRADGEIRLSSNTTLTTGTLSSGNRVFLTAGGAIITGAIDAGTVNPQAGASGVLFATSPATIRTGPINVSGSATLSGVLGVTTGNIAAPGGIVLLDTGGINAGNLTTSPSGFVYIAAHDLLPQITFDQLGNPQFGALLASTPIRLVGDINVGDATTGRFIAAATGSFFVNNATAATSMLVDVGGTATLDFNIATPSLTVTASDIELDPLAAVGAAGGGILFNTTGATTVIVGGANAAAVPGTYRLSNAEFGALRASSITVRSFAGGMTVDQLALPAIAPGQATNPGVTLRTNGTLRVAGAVTMAQAGAQNQLNLIAGTRVEVVQGSGSVRLGAGVDTPAGTLAITAPRLWVASDSLLTQLAGTSLTGQARIDAVNAAGAPTVVGGSIGAGTILIGTGDEVLIQNSGTDRLKAGFTTGTGGLRIRRAFEGNNPINVVINGRIQRADNSFAINSDTLALVQLDPGISLAAAGSTVNGCIITTATCPGLLLDELFQPVVTIVNNIEELTPEQEEKREAAQEAAEKLPIVLLQRLIDFSPMFVDPDATDPVTSGGNPALWMDPMPRGVRTPGGLN